MYTHGRQVRPDIAQYIKKIDDSKHLLRGSSKITSEETDLRWE